MKIKLISFHKMPKFNLGGIISPDQFDGRIGQVQWNFEEEKGAFGKSIGRKIKS